MGEGLETGELQEKLNEALEHAEKAGEEKASPKWITLLSLSTAVIAVMAAIASLQAGRHESHALLSKNSAVLAQAKTSDQWAYYQAKGIKATIYKTQAQMASASAATRGLAPDFEKEAERYKTEQEQIKTEAEGFEKQIEESNEKTEHAEKVAKKFSLAVTLFQVSIAMAAIAALMRRRVLWYVGLFISVGGLWFLVHGFLLM